MIKAVFDPGGIRLRMTGHADYGHMDAGFDMVCCAASTLMYTFVFNAELSEDAAQVIPRMDAGDADILIIPKEGRRDALVEKLEPVLNGLIMLEAKWPEHIMFRFDGDE